MYNYGDFNWWIIEYWKKENVYNNNKNYSNFCVYYILLIISMWLIGKPVKLKGRSGVSN